MDRRFYLYLLMVILFCISGITEVTDTIRENECNNDPTTVSVSTPHNFHLNDLHTLVLVTTNTMTSEGLDFFSKTFRGNWKNTILTYTSASIPDLYPAAYYRLIYSEHRSQLYARRFYLYYLGKQII